MGHLSRADMAVVIECDVASVAAHMRRLNVASIWVYEGRRFSQWWSRRTYRLAVARRKAERERRLVVVSERRRSAAKERSRRIALARYAARTSTP